MHAQTPGQIAHAQAHFIRIREDLSTRLWSVNAGMSSADFNQRMDQMALVQVNFEARNVEEGRLLDRRLGEPDRRAPRA